MISYESLGIHRKANLTKELGIAGCSLFDLKE